MSSENNELVENYVILKPKEASFRNVFMFILPSGSKQITNLIDCPDGEEKSYTKFRARWTIFVSILLLKFLLVLATPLKMLGKLCLKLVRGRRTVATTQPSLAPLQPQRRPPRRRSHTTIAGVTTFSAEEFQTMSVSKISADFITEGGCAVNLNDTSDLYGNNFRSKVRCKDWEIMDFNDTTNLHDNEFKYYGALTILASKLAYSRASHVQAVVNDCWQMKLLGCYDFFNDFQKKHSTHAFMFENTDRDPNVTIVAFRGTNPFDVNDWMVDFNFSWYKIKGVGNLHSGFLQALGLQNTKPNTLPKELAKSQHNFAFYDIRQKLRDIVEANSNAKFIITGHSLGGALASLFVTLLALHKESDILKNIQAVYTYGQPRVGDIQYKKFMERTIEKYDQIKYYRYVYSFDLVPRVPFDSLLFKYKHFGECVYFDCFYDGQILKKPPGKNYFSIIWLIPKYFGAWFDLIRSLIFIPLFKGRVHFEGFATIFLRCLGLIIPGLPAHICPNYVNLSRWGTIIPVPEYTVKRILKNIACFLGVSVLIVCGWGRFSS